MSKLAWHGIFHVAPGSPTRLSEAEITSSLLASKVFYGDPMRSVGSQSMHDVFSTHEKSGMRYRDVHLDRQALRGALGRRREAEN